MKRETNPWATILIVDDEKDFRENIAERLTSRGYAVLHAEGGAEALAILRKNFVDLVLLDIKMPGMDGITALGHIREIDPTLEAVMITGQGTVELAVEAMQKGAYHFVTKPVRLRELEALVEKAIEKTRLSRQNCLFREERRRRMIQRSTSIVAVSESMKTVLEHAGRIAQTDSTVVLEGETGTGKELVAEFIQAHSPRCDQPYAVLNCGALSETLIDAELFGYEKGAFTGATEARPGMFEVAHGGTLLLDEIGEMAQEGQIRLLRVLEKGLCRRVGSMRERLVDVRILAATNRNLEEEARSGRFREDLFHRLRVFSIAIPPLRSRREDILPLAEAVLANLSLKGRMGRALSDRASECLRNYSWPGNVRELSHTIERACLCAEMAGREIVEPEDLGIPVAETFEDSLLSLEEAQDRHIRRVLERMEGNRGRAAEVLGVSERHLYRLLQKMTADSHKRS